MKNSKGAKKSNPLFRGHFQALQLPKRGISKAEEKLAYQQLHHQLSMHIDETKTHLFSYFPNFPVLCIRILQTNTEVSAMFKDLLLVGLGGGIGSMLRYAVSIIAGTFMLPSPLATFGVNAIGSLAIGIIMATCNRGSLYLFAAIGLCGGFTTFSTFSAQSVELLQSGQYTTGLLYIFITLCVCLLFTWGGLYLGDKIR